MSGWRDVQLADLVRFRNGKSTKGIEGGEFPVYGSNGIIGTASEPMYENAIILGRVGAYCGSVEYCPGKFWATDNTIVVEPYPELLGVQFAAYMFQVADLNRYAGGAAQPLLTQTNLKGLSFVIPPLETQRRIASILGAYDDLIEVNRRRVAVLEEMARGLFEEWFVRFRFPGHENVEIVETPDGPLPDGWRAGTLGDLVENRRDTTGPGDHLSERAYVPIECIGRRSLALDSIRHWAEAQSSLQLFSKGDILFGAMRAYFHKVAPAPMDGVTRSTCFVLRPRKDQLAAYSLMTLFRDETVAYATTHSKGSTIPYAQWAGVLERMQCLIPEPVILNLFQSMIQPKVDLITNACVRRQNIWLRSRRRLAECGPRLVVDVRRQACGVASADIRWSVV
jgi:type I restriction enzyme S subunit